MDLSRRHFLRLAGGGAAVALSGCDRWPEAAWFGSADPDGPGPFRPPKATEIDLATHVLNRFTFGARPGDRDRLLQLGATVEEAAAAWLEEQLAPEQIDDSFCERRVRRFETLRLPAGELFEYQPHLLRSELMRATLLRAGYSRRQLYEVMVQFWSDHFNIDPSKGDCQWLKVWDDREVIRRHALGRFPVLLRASALSPAMLWYLDGRVNRRRHPDEKPNENYARELLELHTLGVHGGYTQQDVMEVARCLTGWTVRSEGWWGKGKVEFRADWHDDGPKVVLGHKIPAGLGRLDLDRVLDIVAVHPATARHLATKLCQRFIDEEPPAAAVDAVAAAFERSGGDIPQTLRALFRTPAFQSMRGNRLRRPFEYVVAGLRATAARTNAGQGLLDYLFRMGHAPFNYPTPDGYPLESAPWLGTLLWRWHFAVALTRNEIPGTRFSRSRLEQKTGGVDGLMAHLLGRQPTALEREMWAKTDQGPALLLAGPAFQRC